MLEYKVKQTTTKIKFPIGKAEKMYNERDIL